MKGFSQKTVPGRVRINFAQKGGHEKATKKPRKSNEKGPNTVFLDRRGPRKGHEKVTSKNATSNEKSSDSVGIHPKKFTRTSPKTREDKFLGVPSLALKYTANLYRNAPPICIAIHLQFVLQYFWCPIRSEEREIYCKHSSHLYRSTSLICIATRLPFVSAVLLGKSWWMWPPGCSPTPQMSRRTKRGIHKRGIHEKAKIPLV